MQRIRSVLDATPRTLEEQEQQSSREKLSSNKENKRFLTKPDNQVHDVSHSPSASGVSQGNSNEILTLQNKTPLWNEAVQVYQLDFGGRVTQESAKNFQIEYQNKQVCFDIKGPIVKFFVIS